MTAISVSSHTTTQPLPTRTAYGYVALAAAIGAGPSIWGSAVKLAAAYDFITPNAWTDWTQESIPALAVLLCGGLAHDWWVARTQPGPARQRSATIGLVLVGALGACCVSGWPWDTPTAAGVGKLLTIVLLGCFARELLLRHGIKPSRTGLGLGPAADREFVTALAAGVTLIAVILTCTQIRLYLFDYFPVYAPGARGFGSPFQETATYAWTSVVEELLLCAVVVTLLAAARRPVWEWLLVAAVLRLMPHLYLGLSALDTLLLGAGAAWLFYRYRDVLALIAGHFTYNTVVMDLVSPTITPADLRARWVVVAFAWIAVVLADGLVKTTRRFSPARAERDHLAMTTFPHS
ncbi:type II CAAX prenyl endopeptidase Rce1 family protein [Streptomyces sp. NPDC127098]|uniref:CPBP family glutamic-type intramembrane protease n=1 Tax=Streptomyces sp. NPDC127098 TaxID=3347137 RepID=UPI0036637902